jgi:hypothetical protein
MLHDTGTFRLARTVHIHLVGITPMSATSFNSNATATTPPERRHEAVRVGCSPTAQRRRTRMSGQACPYGDRRSLEAWFAWRGEPGLRLTFGCQASRAEGSADLSAGHARLRVHFAVSDPPRVLPAVPPIDGRQSDARERFEAKRTTGFSTKSVRFTLDADSLIKACLKAYCKLSAPCATMWPAGRARGCGGFAVA